MTISILTITYQCEKYIDRCYYSISKQTYPDWEWVVVDDGSSDNTQEKIESIGDQRIKYFCLSHNQGRGYARNFALDKLSGDWCVILDMDDLMDPRRLEFVSKAKAKGYDYLISSTRLIDDFYQTTGIRNIFYQQKLKIFTHATLCIKTEIIRKIRYSESRHAEDQRVILLVTENQNGEFLDIPLYIYHENASLNLRSAILSNWAAFNSTMNILFKERSKRLNISILIYALTFGLKFCLLNIFRLLPSLYNFSYRARSRTTHISDIDHPESHNLLVEIKARFPVNAIHI